MSSTLPAAASAHQANNFDALHHRSLGCIGQPPLRSDSSGGAFVPRPAHLGGNGCHRFLCHQWLFGDVQLVQRSKLHPFLPTTRPAHMASVDGSRCVDGLWSWCLGHELAIDGVLGTPGHAGLFANPENASAFRFARGIRR